MPTTFANSRPKMGRIWVITSGGVKHGSAGRLWPNLGAYGPPLADPLADLWDAVFSR